MKVSVIIALFNSQRFLSKTIDSVIKQTYSEIELILVDDSSIDSTIEIAKEYQKNYSNIIVCENLYNKGISGAMNTGLDIANGEFIAYLDHDDIALSSRIEKQVKFLVNNVNIGVCGTWMKEFGDGDNTWEFPETDDDLKALSLLHSPIANPTAMLRKSILDKYKIRYKSNYDISQDYEFWLQLLPYTKFANIPEVLVMYRIHSNNASHISALKQYSSWSKAVKPLIKRIGLKLNDEQLNLLYNMKYPSFFRIYKSRIEEIDKLINLIIKSNKITRILPEVSLEKIFENKIQKWRDDSKS